MAKELTISEFARMGGKARAERHSKEQLKRWAKRGGRPRKLTGKNLKRLREMLAAGKPPSEISEHFGVSLRTVGRYAARQGKAQKPADNP